MYLSLQWDRIWLYSLFFSLEVCEEAHMYSLTDLHHCLLNCDFFFLSCFLSARNVRVFIYPNGWSKCFERNSLISYLANLLSAFMPKFHFQSISNQSLFSCKSWVLFFPRTGALADLCQLDNGGCQQVCYNLCNLKVQCGCWPGYNIAYDAKTCIGKWRAAWQDF